MFFTRICRIIAILALGLAIVGDAFKGMSREEALAKFTPASTTGEVFDTAFYVVFAAILLGTLAEITFH